MASAITLEPQPLALRSTRNHPRRAVRRGASWTAAYHLQLTVAAVARPVRSSVGALGVLAAERSWLLLAQTTLPGGASSRYRAVGRRRTVDPASRHATASVAGVRMRCPPIRVRRPGSGCPAVRCPVTWGRRPEGPALGRLLSTRPVSSRLVSAPVRPDASVSSHAQAVALGTRSRWPGDRDHRTGGGPGGCRAVDGSIDDRGGRDAGDAAEVGLVSERSVADPGRRVGAGRGGRA
jgi:hypothetical protein